jgi:hypothetical protein
VPLDADPVEALREFLREEIEIREDDAEWLKEDGFEQREAEKLGILELHQHPNADPEEDLKRLKGLEDDLREGEEGG